MKQKLVIFTSYFPYTNLESFLESEIIILSRYFSSIEIIPSNRLTDDIVNQKREIPLNVSVRSDLNKKIYQEINKRILRVAKCFFNKKFWKILTNEINPIKASTNNLNAIRLAISRLSVSLIIYEIIKSEYEEKFKEIIFYSYWMYDAVLSLGLLKKEFGITCVSRAHGADLYINRKELNYLPFHFQKISTIDKVVLISNDGYSYLLDMYGEKIREKLVISKLGVFSQQQNKYKREDQFRIISCSYLRPMKRVPLLAEAIAICNFPLKWVHIGDGEDMEKIIRITSSFPNHIECILVGSKPNKWIINYYRNHQFDLFVNVSNHEGLPMAIMEAQSFGIPVLATDVGGNSELVNSINGFLVPGTITRTQLATEIKNIYEMEQDVILEKRRAVLKTWEENSNAETQYGNFVKIIKTL